MTQRGQFRGDIWFDQQVHARVKESLIEQEACFARTHGADHEEALLDYVREQAVQLGFTPNAGEIIGGKFIMQRVGSWEEVVKRAGLPPAGKLATFRNRQIYKQEYQKQIILFKQERDEQKQLRKEQNEQRTAAAQAAQAERLVRDKEWGEFHNKDTDEQILVYLRQCAEDLGHSPVTREVVGGNYISKRFVSWAMALTCAGLELPKGMRPPKKSDVNLYRRLQKERNRANLTK